MIFQPPHAHLLLVTRWSGIAVLAVALSVGIVLGANASLESMDRANREARVLWLAGPAYSGGNRILVNVKSLDTSSTNTTEAPAELRVGIAYRNHMAYWSEPIDIAACGTSWRVGGSETILNSRLSGQVILAIGPIAERTRPDVDETSDFSRGPIVWIEGQAHSVIGRKSVEGLIEMNGGAPKIAHFDEPSIGVRGEIELIYVM